MYNIRSGSNGGLESALFRLAQVQVDCGVMQYTKLTYGVYTRDSSGFRDMATAEPSAHHEGVALFYRKAEHFAIKELRLQGPNFINFQLVLVRWRWHIVECYIAPSGAFTIDDVISAIRTPTLRVRYPCGQQSQCQTG